MTEAKSPQETADRLLDRLATLSERMHSDGEEHVVRKHDFIFLPPGVDHDIHNTGLVDLVFLVVTAPVTDEVK